MKTKLALIVLALAQGACEKENPRIAGSEEPPRDTAHPETELSTPQQRKPLVRPEEKLVETLSHMTTPLPAAEESPDEIDARRDRAQEERRERISARLAAELANRDSNNDGRLGRDEVQGSLQKRFIEADKDGDGFLSPAEQETMISNIAERFTGNEPKRGFHGTRGNAPEN